MRGRKAFTWSATLTILLGLLVIIGMALGPGKVIYEFAKEKFFGEKGIFAKPPRGDFVPWTGPSLTDDDIIALDSMAALQCGSSGTAVGHIMLPSGAADDAVCPQNREGGHAREVRNGRVCYGQACARCEGIKQSVIKLTPDHEENTVRIANSMLSCMYNAKRGNLALKSGEYFNCGILDPSESQQPIRYADVKPKLTERDTGDITIGNSVEWDSDIEATAAKRYCIYYDVDWGSWDDIAVGECPGAIASSFQCIVENFQLPQTIDYNAETYLYPPAWLAGYGDPKFLAYYESFQEEAAEAWHTDSIDLGAYLIIGSGFLNMLGAPGSAKVIKETAKEGAQKGFLTLAKTEVKAALGAMKSGIKKVVETIARIGERNLVKTIILHDVLRQSGKIATNELDDVFLEALDKSLSKDIGILTRQELEEFYFKNVFKTLDDAALEALDDPAKYPGMQKLREEAAKDLAVDAASGRAKGQAAARLNEQYKDVFLDVFTRDTKGAGIKLLLKDQSKKAFFTQFIKKTGEGAAQWAISREAVEQAVKKGAGALAHKSDDAAAAAIRNADSTLTRMLQGAYKGSFGDAPITDPVRFVANQLPFTFEGMTSVQALAGNNFNKMGRWVKDHKYPIMVLLMVAADDFDKANEKYVSVGANSLALFTPTGIGEPVQYPLHIAALPYYYQVQDTEQHRLHAVSPCKADLVLRDKKCMCKRQPTAWHFNFGGGLSDVKPGTIGINDVLLEQYFNDMFNKRLANKDYARHPEWATMSAEQFKKNRLKDFRALVDNYHKNIIQGSGLQGTDIGFWSSTQEQSFDRESFMQVWDFAQSERLCETPSTFLGSETAANYGSMVYSNIASFWDQSLDKNVYAKPKYAIDCVSVEVSRASTEGPNYCVNKCTGCSVARGITFAASLAIDIFVTAATGGLGTPVALFVTGASSAWIETWIADYEKWPGDGKWSQYKDFFTRLYS